MPLPAALWREVRPTGEVCSGPRAGLASTWRSRTKTPQPVPASKYLTPATDPSFFPLPADAPVSLTPTQSVPPANWTSPR